MLKFVAIRKGISTTPGTSVVPSFPLVLTTLLNKQELQLPLGYFYASSTITFINKMIRFLILPWSLGKWRGD